MAADFATTGLSVRAHPMALVRPALAGGRVRTVRELERLAGPGAGGGGRDGDRAAAAGDGPAASSSSSLEDETGIANLVVMPDVYERYRPVVRGSPFLLAGGRVERSGRWSTCGSDALAPLDLAPAVGHRARYFR